MRQQLERNIIVVLLTIVLIVLNIVDDNISKTITIQNYQLSLNSLIISAVIIIINLIKSTKLLALSFNFARSSLTRLTTISTYYFYVFTLLTIFVYNRDINLLFAVLIIFSEVLLIIFNLVIYNVSNTHAFNKVLLRIKDSCFVLMSLLLINSNIPFENLSVPLDIIMSVIYIGINIYIINILVEEYLKVDKI